MWLRIRQRLEDFDRADTAFAEERGLSIAGKVPGDGIAAGAAAEDGADAPGAGPDLAADAAEIYGSEGDGRGAGCTAEHGDYREKRRTRGLGRGSREGRRGRRWDFLPVAWGAFFTIA